MLSVCVNWAFTLRPSSWKRERPSGLKRKEKKSPELPVAREASAVTLAFMVLLILSLSVVWPESFA